MSYSALLFCLVELRLEFRAAFRFAKILAVCRNICVFMLCKWRFVYFLLSHRVIFENRSINVAMNSD